MVAADLAVERADQQRGRPRSRPIRTYFIGARTSLPAAAAPARRQRSRSAPSSSDDAAAAAGQRPDHEHGSARAATPSCSRTRWRSRRFTRLRTTALPTALLTTKPDPGRRRRGRDPSARRGAPRGCGDPARRPARTHVGGTTRAVGEPVRRGQHAAGWRRAGLRRRGSCGPCGGATDEDRAAGAGAHAQAEAVHLVTATVVRLVGTLAHELLSVGAGRHGAVGIGPGAPADGAFRLAPPTRRHAASTSWTCGTGRHRVTGQRYALARPTGSNRRAGPAAVPRGPPSAACGGRLAAAAPPLWLRSPRSPRFPAAIPAGPHPTPGDAVPSVRSSWTGPLTCDDSVDLHGRPRRRSRAGSRPRSHGSSGSQPVDKVVEHAGQTASRDDGRRTTAGRRRAGERVEQHRAAADLERRPGAAWSTTSSPTSGPGCAPASR